MSKRLFSRQKASSLIVTLLCIAILTVIVVAFLQSMSLERKTAMSYSNILKAKLAAEAGIEEAAAKILRTLPTSANALTNGTIVWTWSKSSNFAVPYTGILTNSMNVSGPNMGVERTTWLFSSTTIPTDPLKINTNTPFVCNINLGRKATGGAQAVPVEWIDLTNTASGQQIRNAWWISDESGRLPVAALGNAANTNLQTGKISDLRVPGFSTEEAAELDVKRNVVSYLAGDSYLQVAPTSTNSPSSFTSYTFPENFGLISHGPYAMQKKMNINQVFSNSTNSTVFVTNISKYIERSLPAYFDRKNALRGTVNRIAASLYDYIDSDDLPTFSSGYATYFSSYTSKTSDSGWPAYTDQNSYYGIEAVPRVNEYLVYYGPASDTGLYNSGAIAITRTVELWNMSQKPVSISGLNVRVFRQQRGGSVVPPLEETLTGWTPSTTTIPANGFVAFKMTRQYSASLPSTFEAYRNSIPSVADMGIIIAASVNGSAVSVIDGFANMNLQQNAADGKAGNALGYSGSGDSGDNRANLGRFVQRWASNNKDSHTPNAANNIPSQGRRYQNLSTWFDRPLLGGALDVTPLGPPAYIKNAPLDYIGELGDLWDPSNDLVEELGRPRGGKTLVIGQFDPYFKVQNGVVSSANSSYQSYLRRADAALLDVFTVNDDPRININSPRALSETNRPLAVLSEALTLATAFPQASKPKFSPTRLELEVVERLAKTNWLDARPFRNMNDLVGMGNTLTASTFGSGGTNFWSASASKLWTAPLPTDVNVTATAGGPITSVNVLNGNDRSREEAFRRISNWIDFSSLTFRVNSSGQINAKNGKQIARVDMQAVVGFIPTVTYDANGASLSVTYTPKIEIIPDE